MESDERRNVSARERRTRTTTPNENETESDRGDAETLEEREGVETSDGGDEREGRKRPRRLEGGRRCVPGMFAQKQRVFVRPV